MPNPMDSASRVRFRCTKSLNRKIGWVVLVLTGLTVFIETAHAQIPTKLASQQNGMPDLQGFWTNVSMTTLERPNQIKSLVVAKEDVARIEATRANALAAANAPTDAAAPAPTIGQGVVGYNTFWLDGGTRIGVVKGEARSSWIIEPDDGKIPYTEQGKEVFEKALIGQEVAADGPEARTVGERCLIGFGSTGGPPMLNVGYNNLYQIVQTDDHLMILVEMNHDARIIRLEDAHREFPQWLGDSIGRWDGDTLVVETRNFRGEEALRFYRGASFYISPSAIITERFTRWAADELLYEFEVIDPAIASRPWRAEMTFVRSPDPVFEYACHEGNYAMPNILGGSRAEERAKTPRRPG